MENDDLIAGQSVTWFWLEHMKTRLAELREEMPGLWFTIIFPGPGIHTFFGMDYRATRESCRDELIDAKCPKWQLQEKLDEFEAAKAAKLET